MRLPSARASVQIVCAQRALLELPTLDKHAVSVSLLDRVVPLRAVAAALAARVPARVPTRR